MAAEPEKPQTNKAIIFVVVLTLAINVTLIMSALLYCLILKVEPNTALLTGTIAMANYILGVISGMLVKTSPSEATKAVNPNLPNGGIPPEVTVVNKPDEPVPTTESK